MSATIDIFDKRSITNAINKIKVVEPFVLSKIFGSVEMHSSEKIDIEIYSNTDKVAQFVNPLEGSQLIGKGTKSVQTLTVPRTFERKAFSAYELANYSAIGQVYASPSETANIANAWTAQELADLKTRIIRRREQMACEALATGGISVTQDNIAFTVDYGYDTEDHHYNSGDNLIDLEAAEEWDASNVNPLIHLREWKRQIMKKTGLAANLLILGSDAADAFIENADVMKALDNNQYKAGVIDLNGQYSTSGMYIGTIMGIQIYEYNQDYTNYSGVSTPMIAAARAILVATQSPGFRIHSAPMYRIEGTSLKPYQTDMLVEPKTNEEKTVLEWSIEQKSLPAIHEPYAVVSALVV